MLSLYGFHKLIDFLNEVVEHRLKQIHGIVLAQIPEVRNIVADFRCLVVRDRDVD